MKQERPVSAGNGLILFIYQIGFAGAGLLYLFLRLLRGRATPGLRQRLAWYSRSLAQALQGLHRPIWIHMVSVGEVLAAEPLIQELRRRMPSRSWVITTVTPTGQSVAKRLLRGPQDQLLYLPWDLEPIIRRALRVIHPDFFIAFETELWPVLFHRLERSRVPIVVVNGRISPAGYRRYLWVRPFMERTLRSVAYVLTQSPQDARRYAAIGAPKDRIAVTGNVKWDFKGADSLQKEGVDPLRALLGLSPGELLWTAGSTHPGEEEQILQAFRYIKTRIPGIKLLLAPRHPERVAEVEQAVKGLDLSSVRRSQLAHSDHSSASAVVLLDTLGELPAFYRASDLVFVGGSLVPHGGHNLIEPAAFKRAILTGPHLNNFQAVGESLTQAGGMVLVHSVEDLQDAVLRLVQDPDARRELGRRAYSVVQEHAGATARTADWLEGVMRRSSNGLHGPASLRG